MHYHEWLSLDFQKFPNKSSLKLDFSRKQGIFFSLSFPTHEYIRRGLEVCEISLLRVKIGPIYPEEKLRVSGAIF